MQTLFLLLKPAPSNPQRQMKLHAVSFEEVVPHSPQQSHQLLQLCRGRSQRMEPSRPHSAAWLLGPPPCWHTSHPPQNLIFPIRLRLLQSTHADPSLQDKVIIAQVPKERDED